MSKGNPLRLIASYGDSDEESDDGATKRAESSKIKEPAFEASQPAVAPAGIHPAPIPHCPWSACYDENSGFTYYWNQQTNAVTWEAPPEYLLALKLAQQHLHTSGSTEVSAEEWQLYQQALAEKQSTGSKVIAKPATTKFGKKQDKTTSKNKPGKNSKKRPASDDEDENSLDSAQPDIDMAGLDQDAGDGVTSGMPENIPASPLTTKSLRQSEAFRKLSGAARRRLWKLVDEGHSMEEALCIVSQQVKGPPPSQKPTRNLKRGRSEEESPKEQPKKATKTSSMPEGREVPTPSYRDVTSSVKVGIKHSELMTEEQMNSVHAYISKAICEEGRKRQHTKIERGPSFASISHRAGWLLITCENQESKDWLVREIEGCKPWPEARLSILHENELPKPWTASVVIPSLEAGNATDAMFMISFQNVELSAGHWRVVSETKVDSGTLAVYGIDEESADILRANNFIANLGCRKLVFRLRGEQASSQARASAAAPAGPGAVTPGPSGLGRKPLGRMADRTGSNPRPSGSGGGGAGPASASPSSATARPGPSGLGRNPPGRFADGAKSNSGPYGTGGGTAGPAGAAVGPRRGNKKKKMKGRESRETPTERGHPGTQPEGGSTWAKPFIKREK